MAPALHAQWRGRRFTVVDLFSFTHRTVPGHPELFSADGFHPSSLGYDAWAEVMWPSVEAAARRWQQGRNSEGSSG